MTESDTARWIRKASRIGFWLSIDLLLLGCVVMDLSGADQGSVTEFASILATIALLAGTSYLVALKLGQLEIRSQAVCALTRGSRPIILFLRSFDVARASLMQRVSQAVKLAVAIAGEDLTILGPGRYDVEEELDNAVGSHGTFVAIGNKKVSYGSIKVIVSDADWQETFRQLTDSAWIIFMMPGPSPAVLWELSQIVRSSSLLSKTVFMMPRRGSMPFFSRGFKSVNRGAEASMWAETSELATRELGLVLPPYNEEGYCFRLGTDGQSDEPVMLEWVTQQLQTYVARQSGLRVVNVGELWQAS